MRSSRGWKTVAEGAFGEGGTALEANYGKVWMVVLGTVA